MDSQAADRSWTAKQPYPNSLIVNIKPIEKGWEQWLLLRSDAHHDSCHCDRRLEKRHLDEAAARDAIILDAGDLFDAMQGPNDRRAGKGDTRPELDADNYLDRLVEDAAEFYMPYAKHWLLLAHGNHETSVLRHTTTDLTKRLAAQMSTSGYPVFKGGYGGWVRFQFRRGQEQQSIVYKYYHGKGGSSDVTKGTIQAQRNAVRYNADLVHTGHVHNEFVVSHEKESMSQHGKTFLHRQVHICTAGYKDGWGDGTGGFDVEKLSPKVQGACWVRFFYRDKKVQFEVTPAW